MKKIWILVGLTGIIGQAQAQRADKIIRIKEVSRVEKTLSSDELQGRAVFTPGIEKAAGFIAAEFDKAGLSKLPGADSYLQSFKLFVPELHSQEVSINGYSVDSKQALVITPKAELEVNENSGYAVEQIAKGASLGAEVFRIISSGKNTIVLVDTSFSRSFPRLAYFKKQLFEHSGNTIFLLTTEKPNSFSVKARHSFTASTLSNVVGILPGKSKPDEYVIFSGHYDHLGIGKPLNGDSIYNGANDDAAGSTAVVMLAKYFAARKDNARTIIFTTFTAEESGGFGSQYFSRQFDPAKVMAMFNIEMIGTESKWGKNSAYITGYDKTNMGEILAKNLKGSKFSFHPDPYPDQDLFYRSDNATLARQGVPAHTISTSKMDSEPYYHTADDEFETLDMANMTEIIKAIAISAGSIIAAKDTPSRVDTSSIR